MTESSEESEHQFFSCEEPPITRLVCYWGCLETSTQTIFLDNGFEYKIVETIDSQNWLTSRTTDGRKFYIRIYGMIEKQYRFE